MKTPSKMSDLAFDTYTLDPRANRGDYTLMPFSREDIVALLDKIGFGDLFTRPAPRVTKKSFLVFKHHKYITVPIENISFFYVKYESTFIVCSDRQEYSVNLSLDQVQHAVSDEDFFRINRQYLVNFHAVKEAEHTFARKLLVKLTVETQDKLLIAKEKVTSFLHWLENR